MSGVGYVTEQALSVTSRRGRFVEVAAPADAICKSVRYMSVLFYAMCELSPCTFNDLNAEICFHAIVEGTGTALVVAMCGLSFATVCCVRFICTSP